MSIFEPSPSAWTGRVLSIFRVVAGDRTLAAPGERAGDGVTKGRVEIVGPRSTCR
jgi:hypothetical protein